MDIGSSGRKGSAWRDLWRACGSRWCVCLGVMLLDSWCRFDGLCDLARASTVSHDAYRRFEIGLHIPNITAERIEIGKMFARGHIGAVIRLADAIDLGPKLHGLVFQP